ncbi:MAG: helix-turn-helix transcriptional regulator [Chloroflexi bacterium]|nr:helix-turn-helix transcriptional regulator [Chloroflexota bacterium]
MMGQASTKSAAPRPSAEPNFGAREDRPMVGSVLRHARIHHQLSLREVERRIGKSNAYLSQVERGLIKQPDPIVLLELSDLYGLNFQTLATWALWVSDDPDATDAHTGDSTTVLVRQILQLDASQRATVLRYVDSILREHRT